MKKTPHKHRVLRPHGHNPKNLKVLLVAAEVRQLHLEQLALGSLRGQLHATLGRLLRHALSPALRLRRPLLLLPELLLRLVDLPCRERGAVP